MYRDKSLLIAHIGLACILGVFAGGLYFDVDITISGFQNRVGSLFFLGVLLAFSSLRYVITALEKGYAVDLGVTVHCTTS